MEMIPHQAPRENRPAIEIPDPAKCFDEFDGLGIVVEDVFTAIHPDRLRYAENLRQVGLSQTLEEGDLTEANADLFARQRYAWPGLGYSAWLLVHSCRGNPER